MRDTGSIFVYVTLKFTGLNLVSEQILPTHPGIRIRKFSLLMEGGTPLSAASPNISADFLLYIRECAGNTWYYMNGDHNEFPWFECYLDGNEIFQINPVEQSMLIGLNLSNNWHNPTGTWILIN